MTLVLTSTLLLLLLTTLAVFTPLSTHAERTRAEAAVAARRLLLATGVGDLATVLHAPRDPTLHGMPYAGPEYLAACPNTPFAADPLVFISPWSVLTQNVLARNGAATLSVRMLDPMPYLSSLDASTTPQDFVRKDEDNPVYTPMPYARMALVGHMRTIPMTTRDEYDQGMRCFLSVHPDAQAWANMTTPENHAFTLMQLHVDKVHWVGGFGDRHWIGWMDRSEYVNASV